MSVLYLQAVGVLGPGLAGWHETRRILGDEAAYCYTPAARPNPETLPPNERRRSAKTVLWAVAVAEEALRGSDFQPAEVATVFTSSSGDGETLHQICEVLAAPVREVSPTRFHNSVHNAPAGYWSIASGSRLPSVALCGYDASFGVGLLEAAAQIHADDAPVLLVAYDLPYPEPLHTVRTIAEPLAIALLFSRAPRSCTIGRWRVELADGAAATRFPAALPSQLMTNPAAHALPLLAAVACGASESVPIAYLETSHLRVEVRP